VSQQVDGAIPNAAQFGGQDGAVTRTLAFGPNRSDEHTELVCKRDKPLVDPISSQWLFPCGLGPGHDAVDGADRLSRALVYRYVSCGASAMQENILPSRSRVRSPAVESCGRH
jgi:hypothetical protein